MSQENPKFPKSTETDKLYTTKTAHLNGNFSITCWSPYFLRQAQKEIMEFFDKLEDKAKEDGLYFTAFNVAFYNNMSWDEMFDMLGETVDEEKKE